MSTTSRIVVVLTTVFGLLPAGRIGAEEAAKAVAREPGAESPAPRKPRVAVTISKETTYITEPLRADGYPDYVAALNQIASQGVTPENNAAVPFWRAFGPNEIDEAARERFFKMLGIPPLPEEGEGFILYSVGRNEKDDGGRSYDDRDDAPEPQDWDDLAVRVPLKRSGK